MGASWNSNVSGQPSDGAIFNNQIGINASGQFYNASTGQSGIPVSNNQITIGANGQLQGAGGGQVTIGGLGYTGALNATYGATFGSTIFGQITKGSASTYIENAAIGDAQIGGVLKSTNFLTGVSGWAIDKDTGAAEFGAAAIRGQLLASQVDTRGMTIKAPDGTTVFEYGSGFGKNLVINSDMGGSTAGWSIWTRVGGTNLSNGAPYWQQPNSAFSVGAYGAASTAWNGATSALEGAGSLNRYSDPIPVYPGQRLEVQTLVWIGGGFADLYVSFLRGDKSYLTNLLVTGGLSRAQDGVIYADTWGFVTVPADARWAYIDVAAYRTRTDQDTNLIVAKPYLGIAHPYQTQRTVWNSGVQQITPANKSLYIADLSVDTLQIAGNAVSVPMCATGDWVGAVTIDFTVLPSDIPAGNSTVPVVVSGSILCATGQISYFDLHVGNSVSFNAAGNQASSIVGVGANSGAEVPASYQTTVYLTPGTYVVSCHNRQKGTSGYDNTTKRRTVTAFLARR